MSDSLVDNIIFGARVREIGIEEKNKPGIPRKSPVAITYEICTTGCRKTIKSDYLILAIPYTSQRSIAKSQPFIPKQEMAIRDVRYVEVTKILLQYKTRWWEKAFSEAKLGLDGGLVSDLPIRYIMFPKSKGNQQIDHSRRGVVMAAYTFEQDATILGALSPERRIQLAAENLDRIFPGAQRFAGVPGGRAGGRQRVLILRAGAEVAVPGHDAGVRLGRARLLRGRAGQLHARVDPGRVRGWAEVRAADRGCCCGAQGSLRRL